MKKAIAIFFSIGLMTTSFCQNTDIDLLKKINVHRNTSLDKSFNAISEANNYINFGTAGTVLLIGSIKKDKQLQQQGIFLLSTQILTALATQSAKRIIKRDRPFLKHSFIQPYRIEDGYSLPSGHTSSAFANAMAITLVNKKWYVVVPAFTYASLVGYSRMHLGVHYPSDVLLGAAFGVGGAYVSNWLNKKIWSKKNKRLTNQLP